MLDCDWVRAIDGLMRNDVVKSDIHSTDTHGYTEVVFGLTHLLCFSFAPRIKGIDRLTRYVFKPMGRAEDNWGRLRLSAK